MFKMFLLHRRLKAAGLDLQGLETWMLYQFGEFLGKWDS